MKATLLLVDDDPVDLQATRLLLEAAGFDVVAVRSGGEAIEQAGRQAFDAVVSDLRMPGMSGEAVVESLARTHPDLPVVIVTGHGDIPSAVRAMRLGAFDFVTKPIDPDAFGLTLERAAEYARLKRENASLRAEAGVTALLGNSRAMQELLALVDRVARTDSTVLVQGETGTGKELVARTIHYRSRRAARPLVVVNCAVLNPNIVESELFGHEKGAFTGAVATRRGRFEEADGGTLFLDEISEVGVEFQAKLLRVLQEGEFERLGSSRPSRVDVRVIASTNRRIEEEVRAGRFREDLFYRLNVIPVVVPPLRDRRDDIPLLARHFADRYGHRYRGTSVAVSEAATTHLRELDWKGNIRELQHAVERAVVLSGRAVLEPDDFIAPTDPDPRSATDGSLQSRIDRVTRECVREALTRTGGHKQHAADLLGMDRVTLYRLLKRYGMEDPGPAPRG